MKLSIKVINALPINRGSVISKLVIASLVCLFALLTSLPSYAINTHSALHWDDIPQWEHHQGSVSKTRIKHSDWNAIRLAPGAKVIYRIPSSVFSRIFSDHNDISNQLSFYRGDGNGLFIDFGSFEKIDKNLLLMPEANDWQLLIHNTSDDPSTLSVMTSRSRGEKPFPPARTLMTPIDNQMEWLETPHLSQRDSFAYIKAGQHVHDSNQNMKVSYTVEGPAFIEVESVLLQAAQGETQPSYLITSELDGEFWQQWQHQAALYPFSRYSKMHLNSDNMDTELRRSTYSEKHYLQIPKGEHTLSFSSLRPLALRVFDHQSWGFTSNEDLLFPQLKQYQQQQLDYQQALNNLTTALISNPSASHNLLSHWKDTQYPLIASKERALKRSLFYRPLAASTSRPPLRTFNLSPAIARYSSLQGHPDILEKDSAEPLTTDTHLDTDTYAELSKRSQLSFSIPKLSSPTRLRIRIAGLADQPARFSITDQQGNHHTVYYYPKFASKLLETAKMTLSNNETWVAEAFIPLHKNAKKITVKALTDSSSKLQLAYQTYKKPSISESENLQALKHFIAKEGSFDSNNRATLITFLQGHHQYKLESNRKISQKTLADNQLLALTLTDIAHRIKIRAEQFERILPTSNTQLSVISEPKNWQPRVQRLIQQQAWASAIGIVSPLTLHENISIRTKAAKLQTSILREAGDFYIYEKWLLKLLASNNHSNLHHFAENTLIEYYTAQQRMSSLEKLSAYQFRQSGNPDYLEKMADSLSNQSNLLLKNKLNLIHQLLAAHAKETKSHNANEKQDSKLTSNLWHRVKAESFTARSSRLLHGHTMDNYSYRHIASAAEPLEFSIEGPTTLAITHRSLLAGDMEQSQDDWLILKDNQQTHYIPTFQSGRSRDVSIVGSDSNISGVQRIEIHLGAGQHKISIRPKNNPAIIGLSQLANIAVNHQDQNNTLLPISLTKADIVADTVADISLDTHNQKRDHLSPEKHLLRLIWEIEHNELFNKKESTLLPLIAKGNFIIEQQAETPLLNRLNKRLNQYIEWQLEQQLVDSAGRRIIKFKTAPISNPKTKIRHIVNGEKDDKHHRLSPQGDLNFTFDLNTATDLKLQFKQLVSLNTYSKPAVIEVGLNDQRFKTVGLEPNNTFYNIKMSLKPGIHQVRIALVDAKSDQQVAFKAQRKSANSQWRVIDMPIKQAYSVGLKNNPIKVFAAASQWLRFDDYIEGQVHRSHHYQKENGVITLSPKAGQTERLVRIYKLRLKSKLIDLPSSSEPRKPSAPIPYQYPPAVKRWSLQDNLELGEENEGTWGGYVKYTNRASIDDEGQNGIAASMNALQLGHIYQKRLFDDNYWSSPSGNWTNNAYWKSDAFVRQTQDSGDTLGTDQRFLVADPQSDWQLSLKAKIQYFQAANDISEDVLNLYSEAQYQHDWQFNRQQTLDASLTGFAYYLDNTSPNASRYIDPLVYSDYKRDHTYGLRLAGNWRYKLWQDSRFNLGTQLISNESIFSLDQLSLKAGYQQYFKGLTAGLSLRRVQRFSDYDRQKSSHNNEVKGSLRFHHWNSKGNEWYFSLNVLRDISINENTLALTFGFNHSDGRGARDYLPTQLPMRDLYQQQGTQQIKFNTLSDGSSL